MTFEKFHSFLNLSHEEISEVLVFLAKCVKDGIEPIEIVKLGSYHFEKRQCILLSFLVGFYNGLSLGQKDINALPREMGFLAAIIRKIDEEGEEKAYKELNEIIKQLIRNSVEVNKAYG